MDAKVSEWKGFFNNEENEVLDCLTKLSKESTQEEWEEFLCLYLSKYNTFLSNDRESEKIFPSKRWTILHHMAFCNAPYDIVKSYKDTGYVMCSLRDGEDRFALDHVVKGAEERYTDLFSPKYRLEKLDSVKLKQFHAVINSRAEDLFKKHNLVLPDLHSYLEDVCCPEIWYAVLGMYGGFTATFELNEEKTDVEALITSSWCRVVEGSGNTHRCTENEYVLTAEGFV